MHPHRLRVKQLERQAEGYLEMGMAEQALECLGRIGDPSQLGSRGLYLQGEALRAQERYADALGYLNRASQLAPADVHIWVAMGWCHKRTGRVDLAIEDLEQAREAEPYLPLVHYNLACYLSLAGMKNRAIAHLSEALAIDPEYRALVEREPDFDPIRSDPEFQALTSIIV
jgi:tetratricopeptide (TPR) repeat protein